MADDRRFAKPAYGAIDSDSALDTLDTWVHKEAIAGQRVLCLGAGGGTHGPLFAAAGASVTVVDLSDRQLEHDRRYADEHGVDITAVQSSIDDLQALGDASFDIVIQPVCTCYVRDLAAVYHHVARVLQPGGLYLSQHKHPASMQADASPISSADTDTYRVARAYVEGVALPDAPGAAHREAGTVEYLHTLEALLGGLCRAGFVIEDVTEPVRADALAPPGDPAHRAVYLPPYLKIKARRRA
ncbi:MAG: methyltransferase domain-containing protein [Phycisphaera sp.]|nr:methyltransferase domain-containing protein [Phycisphaera sp.]